MSTVMNAGFLPLELIRIIFAVVCAIVIVFGNAVVMGYLERKLAGRFQRRRANGSRLSRNSAAGRRWRQTGRQAIDHSQADGSDPLSSGADYFFCPGDHATGGDPLAPKLQGRDFDIGLIFILAVVAINVLAILIAGWSSTTNTPRLVPCGRWRRMLPMKSRCC